MTRRRQHLQEHHVQYALPDNSRKQPDITVLIRNGVHTIVSRIDRFRGMTFQEVYAIVMAALKQLRFGEGAEKLVEQFQEMMERRQK